MKLKLAEHLSLPLEAVTEKFAWLGRTGSGKTYGAMKCAELMLNAGAQIGAIDPVGVWRGLRVPAVKGGQSFDVVVFGGLYGDLPLQPTAGALIADVVCDRGISFVLDVSQFVAAEQQRFAKAFAERFFQRRKASPAACHLFLEECQEFLPQNPMGLEADTLHEFQRLWKIGRNFGIGGSLISQRPQEINKKALNMSGTLFAFQMTAPQERKAVKEWVADHGVAEEILSQLQKLEIGQPHVESPMFLQVSKQVRILERVTADLSSTPKVGSSKVAARPLTPIDVEQLKSAMAESIEKAKADDPRELRKQLAEANRMLANQAKAIGELQSGKSNSQLPTPKAALTDADRDLLKKFTERFEQCHAALLAHQFDVTPILDALRITALEIGDEFAAERDKFLKMCEGKQFLKLLEKLPQASPAPPRRDTSPRVQTRVDVAAGRPIPPPRTAPSTNGDLGGPERKILTSLAELEALGLYPADKQQVGLMAGYTNVRSGGFSEPLRRLVWSGYVISPRTGILEITDSGRGAVGQVDPPANAEEMQTRVMEKLTGPERKLLTALICHYPSAVTKETLGEECGYTNIRSGGFSEPLGRLNTLGLVRSPVRGEVVASPALFLEN